MIEIKQGEAATYDFSLEINGTAGSADTPVIRFTIAHPDGHLVSYPATVLEHGNYRVSFPNLDPILPPGQHPCALEIVLGDHYFKPMFETLNIVEKPSASVGGFKKVSDAEPKISVVTKPTVTRLTPTPPVQPPVQPIPAEVNTYEAKETPPASVKEEAVIEEIKKPVEEKPEKVEEKPVIEEKTVEKKEEKKFSSADQDLFKTLIKRRK